MTATFLPLARVTPVLLVAILILVLASCASEPTTPNAPETPSTPAPLTSAPPPPAVLSAEAESALQAAELSVVEARVQRVLWISALDQLEQARAAARRMDSAGTLDHARTTIELCRRSLKQKVAPLVTW